MKLKYKILALIPIMAIAGCKKYEHKNVITGKGTYNYQKILLLDDAESHQERIYKFSGRYTPYFFDCLELDDTVTIIAGGIYNYSEAGYQNNIILNAGDVGIQYNTDSIHARRERQKFNQMKSEMNQKSR